MAFATRGLNKKYGKIIDLSKAADVYGVVDQNMSLDGWVLIVFKDEKMITARYESGVFKDEGYLLSKEAVLKPCKNNVKLKLITRGEAYSESGARFEGQLINGTPYGEGILYDSNGTAVYSGIVVNWKREGYGASYYANGTSEYVGTWCNDNRHGCGSLYSNNGQLVRLGEWVNGVEVNGEYSGDGSNMHTRIKSLSLSSECHFTKFSVECFPLLEELVIGEKTFSEAPCFEISHMDKLRSITLREHAFTNDSVETSPDRSFSVTDCPALTVIDIAPNCFSDFAGDFVLQNLPRLEKLLIGKMGCASISFASCSFVVRSLFLGRR